MSDYSENNFGVGDLRCRAGVFRAVWRAGAPEPAWEKVRMLWVAFEPVRHRDVVMDNQLSATRVSHAVVFRVCDGAALVTGVRLQIQGRFFSVANVADVDSRKRWRRALLVEML